MLNFEGKGKAYTCSGGTRRDFLKVGSPYRYRICRSVFQYAPGSTNVTSVSTICSAFEAPDNNPLIMGVYNKTWAYDDDVVVEDGAGAPDFAYFVNVELFNGAVASRIDPVIPLNRRVDSFSLRS